MDKTKLITTAIGVTSIVVQTLVLLPINHKISEDIKKIESRIDQTNQILKEERQNSKKEFKDL